MRRIATVVSTLALVLTGLAISPAHADIPAEGTYDCNTGLATESTPNFSIDAGGVVNSGGACVGAVVIPDGVTRIGWSAFQDDKDITSVELPDSVTSIEMYAFSGNWKLTSVKLSAGLKTIGYGAFFSTALKSTELPTGLTTIETYAFCADLESITIPASVTRIERGALCVDTAPAGNFGYDTPLRTITFLGAIDNGSLANGTVALPGQTLNMAGDGRIQAWYSNRTFTKKVGNAGFDYRVKGPITLYSKWIKAPKTRAFPTIKPTIDGVANLTAKGTRKLTALSGFWDGYPRPALSYQWYSCSAKVKLATIKIPKSCKKIAKATGVTLIVHKSLKRKFIAVAVTGISAGTKPTTWLSPSTAKVK